VRWVLGTHTTGDQKIMVGVIRFAIVLSFASMSPKTAISMLDTMEIGTTTARLVIGIFVTCILAEENGGNLGITEDLRLQRGRHAHS
jgi:hypothetical protein